MVVGITYIFQIEARVVVEGLRLTWDKSFIQVELESDNALPIEVLQTELAAVSNVVEIRIINDLYFKD